MSSEISTLIASNADLLRLLQQQEADDTVALQETQMKVRSLYEHRDCIRKQKEAINCLVETNLLPSAPEVQLRKQNQRISNETRALISSALLYKHNMTWDEIEKAFNVS